MVVCHTQHFSAFSESFRRSLANLRQACTLLNQGDRVGAAVVQSCTVPVLPVGGAWFHCLLTINQLLLCKSGLIQHLSYDHPPPMRVTEGDWSCHGQNCCFMLMGLCPIAASCSCICMLMVPQPVCGILHCDWAVEDHILHSVTCKSIQNLYDMFFGGFLFDTPSLSIKLR